MKKMKVLVSLLLVLALTLGLGLTAFARPEGETDPGTGEPAPQIEGGSITIENAAEDQTYHAYQLLTLESYNTETKTYSYVISTDSDWYAFFTTGAGKDYVRLSQHGDDADIFYVTWNTDNPAATAAALSIAALEYVNDNNIAPTKSVKNAKNTSLTITGLELGYYLVESTVGAACALTTTQPNATIVAKNTVPTIDKLVKSADESEWKQQNSAHVNETVNFKTTIDLGKGSENLVLCDKMSAGLTLDRESIVVTKNGTIVQPGETTYSVDFDHPHNDPNGNEVVTTFCIKFATEYTQQLQESDELVVTYSATVNKDAVIAGAGNPNDTWLGYGDDNWTKVSTTHTYVWEFEVFKFTNDDNAGQTVRVPLAGAKFTIKANGRDAELPFVDITTEDDLYPVYRIATREEQLDTSITKITEITTDDTGRFKIVGVDVGEFVLTETEAPKGYNVLKQPIIVVVDENGNVNPKIENSDAEYVTEGKVIEVLNQSGDLLPQTGGSGTALFYILGGALVLGAAVLLITKRRMRTDND